ncbi:hypothetical protein DEJ37_17035 [Kocuria rosea]|nr:hypothetical protein DEJ37_17035 [Kocuria rosea]
MLEGILLLAGNSVAWKKLPSELGIGAGITCWRRLWVWRKSACRRSFTAPCSSIRPERPGRLVEGGPELGERAGVKRAGRVRLVTASTTRLAT